MGEGDWLVLFIAAQRLCELGLAQWNMARLRAAGGVEFGAAHYCLMVLLHTVWLLALWLFGHDRAVGLLWFTAFVVLQAGRAWVIGSLRSRWTTRVIVLPGVAPVARGPYRWLRHPNYLIVAIEIVVVPLALALPLLALAFGASNAALLLHRIRLEERALAWSVGARPGRFPQPLPRDSRTVS